jgi:hypothetical protein
MLTALLIPLLALPAIEAGMQPADDPVVQVWLSRDDVVWPGERIRVYSEALDDGYLVVLHAEPDGRIRVLFPLDPMDDYYVRGGKRYEVLNRGNREAITVFASEGVGTVLAAYSRDPFRFDELMRGDHWDYQLPDVWWVGEDPESDLLALADHMAGGISFDYDAKRYGVAQAVAAYAPSYGYAYPAAYGYATSGVYLSVGFSFGVPYFAYSPACWGWYNSCYFGWPYSHYGWYPYSPYYYRSVYYGYPYYAYGRHPSYYYPYHAYYPKYTSKSPPYQPGYGADYRRRTGVVGPARAVGGSGVVPASTRRRSPGTPTSGAGVARPSSSGRRGVPTRGAPTARDAGPSRTGVGSPPQRSDGRRGVDRKAPTKGASPARPTSDASRRGTGKAATQRRPEASRPAGNLPVRVYPTRGSSSTSGRSATSKSRSGSDARPQRVVPKRSTSLRVPSRSSVGSRSSALPTRTTGSRVIRGVGARSSTPTRVTGSRAVRSVGGRSALPTRMPSATSRSGTRAPSMARPTRSVSPRVSRPSRSISRPRAPAVRRAPPSRGRR